MIYIYNGSFEGLLTAIFDAYNDGEALIFKEGELLPPLLEYKKVETDMRKSLRLQSGINKKLSKIILRDIYIIYLSDYTDHGTIALKYLRFCFLKGKGARSLHFDPAVKNALTLRRKVMHEADKMLGLVRFDKTQDGVYISEIQPDHNILSLIAGHFAGRMPTHSFVIRDTRRELAICSYNGNWVLIHLPSQVKFDISKDEFRSMWKEYWNSMAIRERLNPRQQKAYMPKRYWKNLTEMQ
ncbi:MAG: TIGR03915 family putative DNA repair protein [Clostridia bacterium]|nr:TIGR03915 family putative DNA repair protein [Clostridia bacterium]